MANFDESLYRNILHFLKSVCTTHNMLTGNQNFGTNSVHSPSKQSFVFLFTWTPIVVIKIEQNDKLTYTRIKNRILNTFFLRHSSDLTSTT